ncbi:MAG: right-handed parallel beta-helix repeat-containing protein [Methanobacterium sp.]
MKKTNTKNVIIVLFLLFIGISIHTSFVEPVSAANINVTSTMDNSEIQNVLDSAASGDTINFLGTLYTNIQLTINKTLNIVTHVGTVLSGSSSSGSAVFLINGSKASGTQISGFNITGSGSGILVNSTSNVNISNCNISASDGSSVTINKSSGTNVKNSNMTNSITGINISNSKNTKITGSTVKNNKKNGINVENSVNTTINNDKVTGNAERGVKIYNSNNTVVNGSTLTGNGNKAGISSDEGAVYIKGSNGVKISSSQINSNSQGITTADSSSVTINNNTITENYGEGILLDGTLKDVSIKNNYIKGNCNGIVVNYHNGTNIHISGNIITRSSSRTLPGDEDTGIGISFGPGYTSNSKTNVIEHNVILRNGVMDMRAMYSQVRPDVGSNWYGSTPRLCPCVNFAASIKMVIVKIGLNTYAVQFIDGITNKTATDLPSILVNFTAGKVSQMGWSSNGESIFHVDSNLGAGILTAIADKVTTNIDRTLDDTDNGNSGNNSDNGNGNGNGGGSGDGTGDSGNGNGGGNSGSAAISGSKSGTSSNVGQAAFTAAAGSSGSAGSNGQSQSTGKKTAQELFIDNTVKNPAIWGIIGIIVLLVLIFGAYYRNDLIRMIKNSKK